MKETGYDESNQELVEKVAGEASLVERIAKLELLG